MTVPILPFIKDAYCPNCQNLTTCYSNPATGSLQIYCDKCHLVFKGTYNRAHIGQDLKLIEEVNE